MKTHDPAAQLLLETAREREVETVWDRHKKQEPRCGFGETGLNCRHCTDAPCVDACITGSMHVSGDGLVTNHDRQERCIRCWMCVMVCPFGVIRDSGEEEPRAVKCDRQCTFESGIPACVRACPTGALFYGDVDQFSAGGRVIFLKRWLKAPGRFI